MTDTLLDRFPKLSILCVGDLMLDRFVRGTVERISPEAPVPVLKYRSSTDMLGGAGNVIANLSALGIRTRFAGRIGKDPDGRRLGELLRSLGCEATLAEEPGLPTAVKTRFIAGNNHLMRFDRESVQPLAPASEAELLAAVGAAADSADLILLSDYAKGVLSGSFTRALIALAAKHGRRVLVDPKGRDFAKYAGAFLIKPNRKELELASGKRLDADSPDFIPDVIAAARELGNRLGISHFVVTLGAAGMVHVPINPAGDPVHLPTEAREVFDVSGAGDTSFASLAAALAAGATLPDAMRLANTASGIVVGKLGTATVSTAELRQALLHSKGLPDYRAKIVPRAEAAARLAAIRKTAGRIGFTNGCFDLLHPGHVDSLWQARAACDFLIVGLNSDASVRRLKGPSRPVIPEAGRATLLASLACVDMVVVFDDATALPLVRELNPDVIAKEGYTLDQWPEARYVISRGGSAVTLKRLEGFSTTDILDRSPSGR